MWNSSSPCSLDLKYYFKYKSRLYEKISTEFIEKYDVDILKNPLCALIARIQFTQLHEERSYYAIE